MQNVQVAVRALRVILHLAVGLVLALALRLDFTGRLQCERLMSWWNQVLLGILNLELIVNGAPAEGARVTVANHVSWLDIPLLGACEPTRFLSKSEVQHWPVAGWLADACGTFYIRRGKGGARPLLERLVPHLRGGGSIVVFPEGTTTDGAQVLPFHPRLFAAAIEARCPVQPVAIRYAGSVAPFIGDDDLVSHVLRVLREPALVAELTYGAVIEPRELSREQLAQAAHRAISGVIEPGIRPPLDTPRFAGLLGVNG